MAETMTYDPGTDTVTTENTLTPDEQNSLQVGEEMQNQQEQLLAGKYKNAEELEKAYGELEKKLGDQEADASEPEQPESQDSKDPIEYSEDGSVNYDQVNETYGEQLGGLFKDNNVDPWAISKHFHDTKGEITDAMYAQLEGAGLSRSAIDSYLAGRAAEMGYGSAQYEAPDLTENDIREITDSVGGKAQYDAMTEWAGNNLDRKTVEAFDNLLDSGDPGAIQLAVNGLKAQFEEATGYEGRMLTGKAAQSGGDVYRSQPELVAAMSDPRYDTDPAYRQDVIEKLDRSDLQF
jgi:hypothetical protein